MEPHCSLVADNRFRTQPLKGASVGFKNSQRQSLRCSSIFSAMAMRSSSFSLGKPGIVIFLSAKAMSNVRCSSRVQTTKEASFRLVSCLLDAKRTAFVPLAAGRYATTFGLLSSLRVCVQMAPPRSRQVTSDFLWF